MPYFSGELVEPEAPELPGEVAELDPELMPDDDEPEEEPDEPWLPDPMLLQAANAKAAVKGMAHFNIRIS